MDGNVRRAMWQGCRRMVGASLVLLLTMPAAAKLVPPTKATELDIRAARSLYNTVKPGSVPTLQSLKADDLKSLDRWQTDDQTGEMVYTL